MSFVLTTEEKGRV